MERLNCSMCNHSVDGGLDGLVRHITGIHGLKMNRGIANVGFQCGQNGCRLSFAQFYGLKRHIKTHHMIRENNQFRGAQEHDDAHPHHEILDDDMEMADNDVGEFNQDPIQCVVEFDFRAHIIGMIARFQCEGSITGRTLTQVLEECEELFLQTRDFLKSKVEQVLKEKEVLNDIGLKEVLQVFELDSPFQGLRTSEQQIEALKDNCGHIVPVEMPLGDRVDDALDHETDEFIDGEASLELNADDLTQMEIKTEPRECILEETNPKENVLPGNYKVEVDGSLPRIDPNIHQSSSTVTKPCSEKPSAPSSPRSHCTEPGPSSSSTPSEPLAADSFARYSSVREVLINHAQGKAVLKAAESGFTEENRRALIRIVVSELVEAHDSHYPPEQAKIALAIAIVKEFPLLKDEKSAKGYEHYYDSISKKGFIEYRLWTMRKTLSPSKKKYNASDRKKKIANGKQAFFAKQLKPLPQEDLDEKVSWMNCKDPTENNKAAIISCLEDTLANRRNWITEKHPTISEIFEQYPRLLDYKGEMIDLEFEKMFEGAANNFLASFPSYYSPRILAYSSSHRPDLYKLTSDINNEHLRALIILVQLLPVSNALKRGKKSYQTSAGKKGKKKQRVTEHEVDDSDEDALIDITTSVQSVEIPNQFLIQIVREGEYLPKIGQNVRRESDANVQPYMICVCGQQNETFLVQGNGWFLDIHNKYNPMIAFDLLFKCYHVLNLNYPPSLQNFYNFMESYIYKIGSQTQSIVSSVHVNIANTKLKSGAGNMHSWRM